MVERKIIPEAELIQIINDKLSVTERAAECRFSGVYHLREPDDAGCNWSDGPFSSGNTPPEVCGPVVRKIISELQGKYNIG